MNDNNIADSGSWHDAAGKFAKNNPGKPKGSTKNILRDKIKSFLNDNWEQLPEWFEKLKPKEKVDTLLALLPYSVSRLQSISTTDSEGNDTIEKARIDYTKLSESTLKEILANTIIEDNEKQD